MHQSTQISAFGSILLFLILGTAFVLMTLFISKLISPSNPNPEKLTTYECGENPTGSSWVQFNMRFYVVALVFLLFDVELIFLFPWATVFGNKELIEAAPLWGWLSFFEMTIFLAILLVGLVYVWKKGDLEWIKPKPIIPVVNTKVPSNLYQAINESIYKTQPYKINLPVAETEHEPPLEKVSERKLFYRKTVEEKEIKQQEENAETSKPAEATPYKPKFKPKTASEPKAEEVKAEPSAIETEKQAYKPRFKPQLAKQESTTINTASETIGLNEEINVEKQAYVPKFKPRLAQKAETTTEEPKLSEQAEPVQEKQAYKPRFKPQLVQKAESSIEEKNKISEEPQAEPVQEKQAYKPKFKLQLVKKQETQENESDVLVNNTTELEKPQHETSGKNGNQVEKEEQPVPTVPTSGYKPRFRAGMVKKTEENKEE